MFPVIRCHENCHPTSSQQHCWNRKNGPTVSPKSKILSKCIGRAGKVDAFLEKICSLPGPGLLLHCGCRELQYKCSRLLYGSRSRCIGRASASRIPAFSYRTSRCRTQRSMGVADARIVIIEDHGREHILLSPTRWDAKTVFAIVSLFAALRSALALQYCFSGEGLQTSLR